MGTHNDAYLFIYCQWLEHSRDVIVDVQPDRKARQIPLIKEIPFHTCLREQMHRAHS